MPNRLGSDEKQSNENNQDRLELQEKRTCYVLGTSPGNHL